MGIELRTSGGIAEVIIDFPPVNALPVQGWRDLAAAVEAAGADPGARTVILTAEGTSATATITDEPLVTIVATDPTASEGGDPAVFTLSRGSGATTTSS